MKPGQKLAVGGLAAVFAACGLAIPMIAQNEDWVSVGYKDAIGVPTRCLGNTSGQITIGKAYTDQQCLDLFATDVLAHGVEISKCIKVQVPTTSHAAFISLGYNIGAANFCGSTLAKKLNAGDLKGACAEISRWDRAGGKVLAGLIKRRAEERAYCERGVS